MNKVPSPLTMQNAIEHAIPLLVKQNCKSQNNGDCVYNSSNGSHCAVGFLIPPENYRLDFDVGGISAGELKTKFAAFENLSALFLNELQALHDNCDDDFQSMYFKRDLQSFCKSWNLDAAFLDTLDFV